MKHKDFYTVMELVGRKLNGNNIPILLTGEAGLGKSTIVEHIAKELDLPYSYIAGSGQTSESKLLGYVDANSNRVETLFTEAYENGGVFCLEEMDAIPASVLVSVNTAIASDYGSFAGRIVKRHKDFYMFATTNTYSGVTEVYSGRNKLDDSTLDRYYKVEITLDTKLEEAIMTKDDFKMIQFFRDLLEEHNSSISTRQALMFLGLKGFEIEKALKMTFLRHNPTAYDMLEKTIKKHMERDLTIYTQGELDEIRGISKELPTFRQTTSV